MRLKGFTLVEIIIVMILSGILVALAIKVIITIMSVSTLQNKTSSQNNILLSVNRILKENFLNSSTIETNENEDLIFNYPDKKSTTISFKPSVIIISNNLSIDTLLVPWERLQIIKLDSVSQLVRQLSFETKYNNIDYPVFIRKEYSNQVLYKKE
jgi:prepilin-type N-terminal cleavage/methylation domain-containing protein